MKKNNKWIIVGVIVLIVLASGVLKKEASFNYGFDYALSEVPNPKSFDPVTPNNYPCIAPAALLDSSMKSCLDTCGVPNNEFGWMLSPDLSCQEVYNTFPTAQCMMDCVYGGYTFNLGCTSTDTTNSLTEVGSTSNNYGITMTDTCSTLVQDLLFEFVCLEDVIQVKQEFCTGGCLDGACVGPACDNVADINTDCIISLNELIDYAEQWVGDSGITLSELIDVAEIWVAGGEY